MMLKRLLVRLSQAIVFAAVSVAASGGFLQVVGGRGVAPPATATGSIVFVTNAASDFEAGQITTLPNGFGDGEFTFEVRVLADNAIGTGDTSTQGSTNQRTLWSSNNNTIYAEIGTPDWWWVGNFLLDGHNNNAFYSGTFSIQIANSGRAQWTFGDGAAANARNGDLHGLRGTTSILDGNEHTITVVRRNDGGTGSILELYTDGVEEDTETSTARTNMASTYWDTWSGYPSGQDGWFIGAEKQSVVGVLTQYEDFKGRVGEMRFWSVARSAEQIAADYNAPIDAGATGLVAVYRFDEGAGSAVADELNAGGDMTLFPGGLGQAITWAGSLF